ncbi:MAG TPA: hypothetical protein DCX32_04745 [Candidatus Moranbacteria bacterium]|nr:hypothetical protein [Candidatus Moranbacteria bacterium]
MIRRRKKSKSFFFFLNTAIAIAAVFLGFAYFSKGDYDSSFSEAKDKEIFLNLDGLEFVYATDSANVGEFLREQSLEITPNDAVRPGLEEKIFNGSRVYAQKARKLVALEGGEEKEIFTLQKTVGDAVREKAELNVGEDDILKPSGESLVEDGMEVDITHVKVEEEKKQEAIAFKTVSNKDGKLGWREKKVTQKGEKGISEVAYKVVYHDEEEISRKKISAETIKEPVEEIVTQGTYVKLGKTHTGLATWYDQGPHPNLRARFPFEGDMFAANPWLPLGSYAKVTNKANGKSVIVRINDRGPFGENRILDLNKPAFAAIASIGAGIIDVKMEEITN